MGTREVHLASGHPTLLEVPNTPHQQKPNWGLPTATHLLPFPPEAYLVSGSSDQWFVTVRATGEFVYIGPGPVKISASQAPF